MKNSKGLRNAVLIFSLISAAGVLLIPIQDQLPVILPAILLGLIAAFLFFFFSFSPDQEKDAPVIRKKDSSDAKLQEVYYKLAKAKTDLLSKEEGLRTFSRIIEQSPTSIVITDIKGNIEYVNPRFIEVTGYSYQELIGQNPRILKSGEIAEEEYKNLWETILGGHTWRGEFHNKKKDGTLYWEFAHIAPVKSERGAITHYIAIKEDITAKKAMDESRKMFSQALQSISDIVIIVDREYNIIYVNDAFCSTFGYSEKDVYKKTFHFLLPEDAPENLLAKIFNFSNQEGWYGEIRCKTKQGRVFYIALHSSAIAGEKREPIAMIGVARDLTEEKNVREITRKAEMLTTIQELAGSVSHEFSQPLQVLHNYISLIKMGKLKKEYLTNSEIAVNRISSLVVNLREITSIEKQDYLNTKIIDLKASARKQMDASEKKVLVVDDEEQILETVTEMLQLTGYSCDSASDGLEALQLVGKNHYNLIISDINMPKMSGTQLFSKLQAIGYKGAFLFMTGYNVTKEISDIIDLVDGLLHKPVDMKKLLDLTEKILGKPSA